MVVFGSSEFLAIDWGTTNRRVYKLGSGGTINATYRDDRGILAMEGGSFAAELKSIRTRFGDLPAICAGMVGSNQGWVTAPYVPAPCDAKALADALIWPEEGKTAIIPGVSVVSGDRVDVMRGEEVQLLGAVAGGYAPPDALLCQPGTHCKWANMANGVIADFRTSMTGELFALLVTNSLISSLGDGSAQPNADFDAGVRASDDQDLLCHLFGIRADQVSGRAHIAAPHSYLSGLLIGSDSRNALRMSDKPAFILAGPDLGGLYLRAMETIGSGGVLLDSHACFVAGIKEIVRNL